MISGGGAEGGGGGGTGGEPGGGTLSSILKRTLPREWRGRNSQRASRLPATRLYVKHAQMTMGRAIAIGATGFTLASLAGYSVWAFGGRTLYRSVGEVGLYASCAVVFILLGSFLLRPLTRLSLAKFSAIFTTAFLAYAVAWCAGWFVLKDRPGEWIGSLAGSVAFCIVLSAWFKAWRVLLVYTLVLFLAHSAGYFAGSWSYFQLRKEHAAIAALAWGFFHGLGMGAGLGFAFYQVQRGQPLVGPTQSQLG